MNAGKPDKSASKELGLVELCQWKCLRVAALLLFYLILVTATLLVFLATATAAGPESGFLEAQGAKVTEAPAHRSRSNASDPDSMLRWVSRISQRPIPVGVRPPAVVAMSRQSLAAVVCPASPDDCGSLAAAYSLKTGKILYRASFDLGDSLHRSFIIHEMVHFLQHLEQKEQVTDTCQQIVRNEREAYRVQAKYLRRHGNTLATLGFPRRMSCQPKGGNEF